MLFSLTCADLDQEPARGEMQRLMHDYRYVNPGGRYVWWVEYQLRGAIHFHGMLLDPPIQAMRRELRSLRGRRFASRRACYDVASGINPRDGLRPTSPDVEILDDIGVVRKWLDAHWHLAEIQSWCQLRSADWFRRYAGAYAMKDVRKLGGKEYEQNYDRMPERWRVYARSDLMFTADDHRLHEDTGVVRLTFKPLERSPDGKYVELYETVPELVAIHKHVPATGGCRLFCRRPPRARRGAPASAGNTPKLRTGRRPPRRDADLRRSRASPTLSPA